MVLREQTQVTGKQIIKDFPESFVLGRALNGSKEKFSASFDILRWGWARWPLNHSVILLSAESPAGGEYSSLT